jgi:hypothetical protein
MQMRDITCTPQGVSLSGMLYVFFKNILITENFFVFGFTFLRAGKDFLHDSLFFR